MVIGIPLGIALHCCAIVSAVYGWQAPLKIEHATAGFQHEFLCLQELRFIIPRFWHLSRPNIHQGPEVLTSHDVNIPTHRKVGNDKSTFLTFGQQLQTPVLLPE